MHSDDLARIRETQKQILKLRDCGDKMPESITDAPPPRKRGPRPAKMGRFAARGAAALSPAF